jgi:hypothetical protein
MFFTFHDDLGNTPARVNRFTGEIQLSRKHFARMPEFSQKFTIEHETGHFKLRSRSEFVADNYAFRKLAGTEPRSLKNSVAAIAGILSFQNPEHMQRLVNIIRKSLEYDFKVNQNPKALEGLNNLNLLISKNSDMEFIYQANESYPNLDHDDVYDNGVGKARRQAKREERKANKDEKTRLKQEKAQLKNDRMSAKNEVKLSRADKNRAKGEAKKTLAEQGKSGNEYWGGIVDSVAGIFGGGKKSSGGSDVQTSGDGGSFTEEKPKFLGMPKGLGIGVVIVAVLGILGTIIFVVKKKK